MNDQIEVTPEKVILQATAEAEGLVSIAQLIKVTTPEEYRIAGAQFADIKARRKELEAKRVAITGPINQSLKLINQGFKDADAQMERAQNFYETPMLAFQKAEDEKRRAAEAEAAEELRRIQAEADARMREELRQMEEAREAAEQARARAAASDDPLKAVLEEQKAEEAEAAAAEARHRAEDSIRQGAMSTVVSAAPAKVTAAGSRVIRPWKHRVIDAAKVPDRFKIVDEQALGAYVRGLKERVLEDAFAVPGVEFYQDMKIGGA